MKNLAQGAFDLIDRFHVRQLKAARASKHWLLLPVKLRMTELNAWKIRHWVQDFAACVTTVFVLKYMSI